MGGFGGGVRAAAGVVATVPGFGWVAAGLSDSTLFEAGGGTEQTTAILAGIAAVAAVAAAVVASRQSAGRSGLRAAAARRDLLAGFAVTLNVVDQWATGSAPHYGSLKFTFLATIVISAACLPGRPAAARQPGVAHDPRPVGGRGRRGVPAHRRLAPGAVDRGGPPGAVVAADPLRQPAELLVAGRRQRRPATSPSPRTRWPASTCPRAPQPRRRSSTRQLSDPQRVYACTRLLAGLAASDAGAQPLVDWLRREWLTNTRQWADVHGYLSRHARVGAAEAGDPARRREQRDRPGDRSTAC